MYVAEWLSSVAQAVAEDEFLTVATVPLSDLVEAVMAGRIPDAKTQMAVLKAARLKGL